MRIDIEITYLGEDVNVSAGSSQMAVLFEFYDGNFPTGGGGAVDSVNGKTGAVVLDAGDIDGTASRFWLTDTLKTAYDSAVTWIVTNGNNLLNHLSNTNNPHNVTVSQIGAAVSANTVQCIGIDTTSVSLTSNTTEQIMHTIEIDGGIVKPLDILKFESYDTKVGVASNTGMRVRISDTPNPSPLSSATLLATWSGTGTAKHIPMNRNKVFVRSATATLFIAPATSAFDDNGSGLDFSVINIDWSVKKYLLFTAQMGSATNDVITKNFSKISR